MGQYGPAQAVKNMNKKNICLLIIFLFILIIRIPYVNNYVFISDEAVFLSVADSINRGQVIYKDNWDFKPPVLYLVFAAILSIFPHSILTIKIFTIIISLLTCTMVFLISSEIFPGNTPLVITFIYGIYASNNDIIGLSSVCEVFTVLPVTIAIYKILKAMKTQSDSHRQCFLFLCGIAFGVAFFIKYNVLFEILLPLSYMFWLVLKRKIKVFDFLCIFAGGFAVFLILLFYLFYAGALPYFYETVVHLQYYFSKVAKPRMLNSISDTIFRKNIILLYLLAMTSCIYIIYKYRSSEGILMILWAAGGFMGKYLANAYFMLLLPSFCTVSAYIVNYMLQNWRNLKLVSLIIIIMFTINFSLILIPHVQALAELGNIIYRQGRWFDREYIENVGLYIQSHTNRDDCIYVVSDYGYRDLIYFISNRRCCTRYPSFLTMIVPVPGGIEEDQKNSFASHPPAYFIVWAEKIDYFNYITSRYISYTGRKYDIVLQSEQPGTKNYIII